MVDKLRPRSLLIICLVFLLGFLLVTLSRSSFTTINLEVNTWAASINMSSFTGAANVISVIFDATALAIASLTLAAILFVKKRGKYGVLLLAAMAGDLVLVQTCKALIMSPRPVNQILAETGYSFPSGHVTGNVVFFGLLAYFAWTHWNSVKVKLSLSGAYIAIVGVVAFDRIYLNVHWFSDIVGAVFLGAFWVLFCILMFKYLISKKLKRLLK
jgi:undecaprenyl-diphosphatase